VAFRRSRRDGMAPPSGCRVFRRTFIDCVTCCRHYAHPSRRSQNMGRGDFMSTPFTVSRALSVSGLVPFEAKLLLAHVLGRDRAWLAAHADETVASEQAQAFDAL